MIDERFAVVPESGDGAWTKSVPSEMEKAGSEDVWEVELTGLHDQLYLTDKREREI